MGTLVKICGICDVEAGRAAVEAGADLIGLHFCPSKRRVEPEPARAIVDALPRRVPVVGVFIDQGPDEANRIAEHVGLDYFQLHGSETSAEGYARPVIKVLKVGDGAVPPAEGWPDPVLLDSWSADQRGGTGRAWAWELAEDLAARRDVIVAGGLTSENVAGVVRRLRPYGVDVSSGVETEPRCKDAHLMRGFVQAVRGADVQNR